jgi:hypothetical protein
MGMGGNKTQTTTQSTEGGSSTNYAPWISPSQQGLAGIALAQNMHNLTPQQQAIAGFTPDQLQGMDYTRRFAADQFGSGSPNYMTGDSFKEYMNPYLDTVGRTAVDGMRREHENNLARSGVKAANGVAFGGSGAALERAQMARGMNEAVPQVLGNIMSQGFDRATNAAMSARTLNDNLDQSRSGRQMSAIQGLLGAGGLQQGLAQKSLDLPYESLKRIAAFVPGVYDQNQSYWSSGNSTQPDNSPGMFQQLLGLGGTILTGDAKGGGTVGGNLLSKLIGG